ncbi:MAG: OadG family protein [Propionibacteriaceae bacterium]|jgi:Na+-transporting methylmalonyl-CoA/oxaloacetate decarboxylase gamma subunit|nr:OadG family protein [Propionibacteriaceae bacterium]
MGFGLQITALGMGTVLVILVALMLVLRAIGWWDQRGQRRAEAAQAAANARAEAEAAANWDGQGDDPAVVLTGPVAGGLSDEEVAAITLAVISHARLRRLQGAPEMRAHTPGSHLFASRWVANGRANQHQPFRRGN